MTMGVAKLMLVVIAHRAVLVRQMVNRDAVSESYRGRMHTGALGVDPVREYTNLCAIWVANHSSNPFAKLPRCLDGRLVPPGHGRTQRTSLLSDRN